MRGLRRLRVVVPVLVSLGLLALLLVVAARADVASSLRTIPPEVLAAAAGLQLAAFALNGYRWQLLLRNVGIRERLGTLTSLVLIGQFCSLFLPTSAGGDAVRAYDVARRSGRPAEALVATLQDRLFGLAATLVIGLLATFAYLPLLPPALRVGMVAGQVVLALGIALVLSPSWLFAAACRLWRARADRPRWRRLAGHPLVERGAAAASRVADLPALRPAQLVLLLGMAAVAVLAGIAMHYVLGLALRMPVGFAAFCLVVPLVWIVRLLPVSLNGVGVGEGAFVFLMGLFAVADADSLALALAMLGLQTALALLGGVLLALRVVRGTWAPRGVPGEG